MIAMFVLKKLKARYRHHFYKRYLSRKEWIFFPQGKFGFIGIANTKFGFDVASHIVDKNLKPTCAFLFAEKEEQIQLHENQWRNKDWVSSVVNNDKLDNVEMSYRPATIYQQNGIPYLYLGNPKTPGVYEAINNSGIDFLLALEAPLLPAEFLAELKVPIINFHSAPLPAYRGAGGTYSAIYNDEKLFLSAHILDKGIDTGPLLMRKHVPVHKGDNLDAISSMCRYIAGELAINVVTGITEKGIDSEIQKDWQGFNYQSKYNKSLQGICEDRLKQFQYSYYE